MRNAGYNSNIASGEKTTIGFRGRNGTIEDEPDNFVLYSYRQTKSNKVLFMIGAENVSNIPEMQIVNNGDYAVKPKNPVRDGYIFVGWYTDESFTEYYDFENTPINKNITLYARWLDYLCDTDTDSDGIVDSLEEFFGTDINNPDTDGDGLTDYQEVYELGTNPLLVDTDNNGIDDYNDDMDSDGVINGEELLYHTYAGYADSDFDGLSDYDEINIYFTNPALKDTDMDGASDGWEIYYGYDPLTANESFPLTASTGSINEANPVTAKVSLEAYDADVESLCINKVHSYDNPYITPSIAGYLGDAYDFTLNGSFDTAELVFEYDEQLGQLGNEFQPRIYYFNEETKEFEELEKQTVENGRVTAVTTHFSTYILLNKVAFDKVWENDIKFSADGENLNIAFVVDLSGSMSWTKLSQTKTAVNSFINVLDDTDKAALVSFTSSALLRCNMTSDKTALKNAVNSMSASGYTAIYKGIEKALDVFDAENTVGYDMVIVFTDGYDEPSTTYNAYYKSLVERANQNNIIIYTIGIGTIDEALLTKVAESTGGSYYYASIISQLQQKVDEIKGEALDFTTDSNNDGISDYHTKLIKEGKLVLSNSSNELIGIDLNYDENGNLTDDCDGDGLKNGEEIKIVTRNGKTYVEMFSHPLRAHSDGDGIDDYTEVQNGSNPLKWSVEKSYVDRLCTDGWYHYENVAADMRSDSFYNGLISFSAIGNGIWNKKELYRDLMIDYYSTYVTQNTIDNTAFIEEKKLWSDTLTAFISNTNQALNDYGKTEYDSIYNINKLISYVNESTQIAQIEDDFLYRIKSLIIDLNRISEDATAMRFEVAGLPYVTKYINSDTIDKIVNSSSLHALDKCSKGIQFLGYGTDIIDTISNLAKVEANNQAFNENMDALAEIGVFGTNYAVRTAAYDVQNLVAEEYLTVYTSAIRSDLFESAGDAAIYLLAEHVGYVAVIVAVRDVMNVLLGSKEDIKQMYRILCYSDLCEAYSRLTAYRVVSTNNKWYHCHAESQVTDINRYLTNISQIRILGEQEYYTFMKSDGFLAFISDYLWEVDELQKEIDMAVLEIRNYADLLKLTLSSTI